MAYRSRSYPDRTGSTDSHLLPAGIRHVPRGSRDPDLDQGVPPARPWQPQHRERQHQRVRFDDSYDEYTPPVAYPRIPIPRNNTPYAYGRSRSPTRPPRPSPAAYYSQRSDSGNPKWERRRTESGDEYQRPYSFGSHSRPPSYPSRSPERIIKSEIYSDPESYEPEVDIRIVPQSRTARSRSPSESSTLGDSASDTELEDFAANVYEFNPSHLGRKVSQDASFSSGLSTVGGEGGEKGTGESGSRLLRVCQSEYTGDGFPEGEHSARLTAVLDSKRGRQPLFRWRHVTQSSMNFDDLSDEVGRIGGLSDSDRHGLVKLLSDVKKYSIKSTPTSKGSNVKHIEPGFLQVKLDPDDKAKGRNVAPRAATWLCIPYFSLQKYAGLLSEATPGSYPTRTLLQEQYSGVPRERDMQQVVWQNGHVPADTCFHVAQLWCIVLDDSLLVTCGSMTEAAIRGDIVDLVTEPSRDPASSGVNSSIYVYYTDAVLYALPVEECRSWFAFISHFHEYWPQTLRFTHRDRLVTAAEWPAMLNLARYSNTRFVLSLKVVSAPQPPPRGELRSTAKVKDKDEEETDEEIEDSISKLKPPVKGKESAAANTSTTSDTEQDKFHVFSWLESFTVVADAHSQEQARLVRTHLQEMHDFLDKETNSSDRKAYRSCPEAKKLDTFTYLEKYSVLVAATKKKTQQKRELEDRIDIFNAAEVIFRFFLPLQFEGPTVGKFWGAVHRLVQMPKQTRAYQRDRADIAPSFRGMLRKLTQEIQSFTNVLSHAQPIERAGITVPLQLIRAWAHLVMALVKANNKSWRWPHLEFADSLIKEGMVEVMQGLPGEDLLSKEVVLPMEIVSLLSLRLLQDSTGVFPNLDMTYSEYLNALDNEVATKPSERSFEHRINLLKQETSVILKIVGKQRRIFTSITADSRLRCQTTIPYTPMERTAHNNNNNNNNNPYEPSLAAPKKRAIDNDDYYYSTQANRAASEAPGHYLRNITVTAHNQYETRDVPDEWTRAPQEYYRISPTHPGGFRDLLAADCLSLIERRYAAFQELFPYAEYLQKYNENKYSDTKDRQEQAIYAFTIVTVIFLPLSAVAGIFGMNTADIRDMEVGQWAYWAAAIPVTILVIVVGLWWMGELRNAAGWVGFGERKGTVYGGTYGNARYKGRKVVEMAPVYVGPEMEMEEAEIQGFGGAVRRGGRMVPPPVPGYGWERGGETELRRRSEYPR